MEAGKVILLLLVGMLVSAFSVEAWFWDGASDYIKDFYGGAQDMWRNYK